MDGTSEAPGTPPASAAGALALLLVMALLLPAAVEAQPTLRARPFPSWTEAWRPLAPEGRGRRSLLEPVEVGGLLLGPSPRVGAFWTAGNPAAAPREIEASWSGFAASRRQESGAYRRPMDPVDATDSGVRGLGWGPVGESAAAAGGIAAGRVGLRPGSHADVVEPYESTPFVLTDTARVDFRRLYARLEGAIGARLGDRWSVGVAGAFRGTENRTRAAPVPRTGRRIADAGRVGVMREVLGDRLRVGAYGTYRHRAEEMSIVGVSAGTQVLVLEGFREPLPVSVVQEDSYFRRIERNGWDAGFTAAGRAGPLRWVGYAERGEMTERQWNDRLAEAEEAGSVWETRRLRVGLAGQMRTDPLLLRVDARWSNLTGDGRTPDFENAFETDLTRVDVGLVGRLLPTEAGWSGSVRLGVEREGRTRVDPTAPARSDLAVWRQEFGVEAARRIGGGPTAALGYGVVVHDATGAIPDPRELGPTYRRMIAPEILLYASESVTHATALTLRWPVAGRVDVWGQARYVSMSPGELPSAAAQYRPDGSRSSWGLFAGVQLGT